MAHENMYIANNVLFTLDGSFNGIGDQMLDYLGGFVISRLCNCNYKYNFNTITKHKFVFGNGIYDKSLFKLVEQTYDDDRCDLKHMTIVSRNPSFSLSPTVIALQYKSIGLDKVISTFYDCLKHLQMNSEVETYLNNVLPCDMHKTIGVHLRHTDKITPRGDSISCSRHEYDEIIGNLKTYIESNIQNGTMYQFYVCSENYFVRDSFVSFLHECGKKHNRQILIVNTPDSSRFEKSTYQKESTNALIELFTLSKCQCVLSGTKYSTFGILACLMSTNKQYGFFGRNIYESLLYIWACLLHVINVHVEYNDFETKTSHLRNLGNWSYFFITH